MGERGNSKTSVFMVYLVVLFTSILRNTLFIEYKAHQMKLLGDKIRTNLFFAHYVAEL